MGQCDKEILQLCPLCLRFVCAEETLWRWTKKERDQGGRKGLRLRLSGRKRRRQERRDGRVIPSRQSLVPAPTVVSCKKVGEMEEGMKKEQKDSTVCSLDKTPSHGWVMTSAPCKPLVIPITYIRSRSRWGTLWLQPDMISRPPTYCV